MQSKGCQFCKWQLIAYPKNPKKIKPETHDDATCGFRVTWKCANCLQLGHHPPICPYILPCTEKKTVPPILPVIVHRQVPSKPPPKTLTQPPLLEPLSQRLETRPRDHQIDNDFCLCTLCQLFRLNITQISRQRSIEFNEWVDPEPEDGEPSSASTEGSIPRVDSPI